LTSSRPLIIASGAVGVNSACIADASSWSSQNEASPAARSYSPEELSSRTSVYNQQASAIPFIRRSGILGCGIVNEVTVLSDGIVERYVIRQSQCGRAKLENAWITPATAPAHRV